MITQEFGEGTAANFLANLGYDAVTSSADSLVSAYLGGGSTLASVTMMASQAASSAIEDAKQRGATDGQALVLGGVNFLAETVTEYLPMDQLLKIGEMPPETVREFLTTALKQMAAEGTEELVSGVIETASDELFMQNLSAMNTSIAAHMADGMSEEDARKAAFKEAVTGILYGGLAGTVSGGLSATAQTAMNLPGRRRQQNTQIQETSPEGQNGVSRPSQTGTEEAPTEAPAGGEEGQQPGTEGAEAQPGTEEAPAGNEETQQPGTESAEAPPSLTEEEAALLTRQQAALAQALTTEDTASRTATLAGVLAAEGGDFEATSAASAAAQHMMTQYGSQTAIEMTREILLTAAELRMSGETLRAALHTAALGEGASAEVLSQIMTEGPSFELLGALVDAASEDVSNPAVQETMRKTVTDNQIATRVKALIADGALSGLRSYEEGVSKASSELRTAQKGFSTAVDDYRVAGENLESLQAQWTQNPSDAALQGAMQQAVKDVGGKAIVVEQYRQSVEKAQEQVKKAQDALAAVREETMKRIREQAQQEVMQAKEKAQAERAQREAEIEAQKTAQRETDNLNAMDAEDFIEQNYPDATEEQKQTIRARYTQLAQANQTGKNEALSGGVSLLMRASRKYGFKVVLKESMNGAEGGYDRKTNTLYVSKAITQSEAIRRVLIHEMTHAAEGGQDSYDRLRSTILDIRYGTDKQRLEADIAATQREYNAFFEANGEVDGETGQTRTLDREGALEEITARAVSELLSGNEEMVGRLVDKEPSVARQMLDAIRRFIDRMRGVNDPEMDRLRRVERMLDKAIREAQSSADGSRDGVQYTIGWTKDGERVVSIDEDILDGVPQKDWAKTVKAALKEKYPNGITVGNNQIQITKKSRNEIVNAHDTMWLKANQPDVYADKLRAANNAGEIVQASSDYVNEGLNHERKDDIVDFARGKVNIEVGGKLYSAEVVVGTRENGDLQLYDFVRMTKKEMQRTGERESAPHSSHAASLSDKSVAQGTPDVNTQSMRNDVQYSVTGDNQSALPSTDVLDREIASFMAMQNTRTAGDGENGDEPAPDRPMRERQFATQTAQRSQAIPQWLKNELINDPNERYYETDTNNDQIVRSWERLQTEGYEAMRERLLAADATLDNADDVADANMLMAMANREGDMQTLLDIARHYNKEGTRQAKAFQARKIFSRMTPAGVRALAAGDCENRLGSWMEGHQPAKRSADRKAEKTSEQIRQLQGGDELLRLEAASEYTITRMDARYGVPINEQQRELIRKFGLENVNRPVFYNKATRQQRMLEAILMEPNPLNATGFGLNLVERLYYCQAGAPVIFNSDLDYIGYNMAQFASAPLDEQEDRFGDLALSRVYEAYGNITEPSLREKLIKLGTGDEDDKKVYGVRSAQGDQYSPYIQLGDENISLAAFSPAASALTMGAVAYDTLKDSDDAIDALMNACFGGLDQIFDASYMTAVQDLFNGVRTTGSFSESAANSVFSNVVSQNVPSLLGQLATALDPYVRDTKDRDTIMQAIKTGIVNKVPGLRQMLPEKVDVAGRSVTSKEGLANFFDPLNRTKVASDPALTELMRLNETLGTSDFMPSDALSGTKTALTGVAEPVEGKDKEAYRKRYGELWRLGGMTYDANGQRVTIQGVDSLIRTSAYQSMSDEEKANAIRGIVSAATTGAAYEMGEKLGHIEKAEKSSGYAKKPVRAMPEQFADSDSPMIKRLADKYEETGDGAFIPKGISQSFSVNKVSYSLEGEEYDLLWSLYEKELDGKLMTIDWVRLSDEELAAAVESAYSSAATAAKSQYAKKHK